MKATREAGGIFVVKMAIDAVVNGILIHLKFCVSNDGDGCLGRFYLSVAGNENVTAIK